MGKEIRYTLGLESIDSDLWRETILPEAVTTVKSGGLIIYPTETSYMLAGDATNKSTMQRLRQIKNRSADHDMSVMFGSMEKTDKWVYWSRQAKEMGQKYFPGPFTFILPLRSGETQYASLGKNLGIRIPVETFLQVLLSRLEIPITATSANTHGGPEPYSVDLCVSDADFIWDAGTLFPTLPSTIISFIESEPRVLRKGSIVPPEVIC